MKQINATNGILIVTLLIVIILKSENSCVNNYQVSNPSYVEEKHESVLRRPQYIYANNGTSGGNSLTTISQGSSSGEESYTGKGRYPQESPLPNALAMPIPETNIHYCPQLQSRNYTLETQEHVKRFSIGPQEDWKVERDLSTEHFAAVVSFHILECPPSYSSSTFWLQSSTSRSRSIGHVGDRYKIADGCGWYRARLPIIDQDLETKLPEDCEETKPSNSSLMSDSSLMPKAIIELFWTSEYRKYSNQVHDIVESHEIKTKDMSLEEIEATLSSSRLQFLESHLDTVPGFPLVVEIPSFPDGTRVEERAPLIINSTFDHWNSTFASEVPPCSDIPMVQWTPVGVINDDIQNPIESKAHPWFFRPSQCFFPNYSLKYLNEKLAGLRIRLLGDSHMQYVNKQAKSVICPGHDQDLFKTNYECPIQANDFVYGWRFFRAIFKSDFSSSMDGLSHNLRHGKPESCRQIFGLSLYNVTILTTPTWLFVYETNEGWDDYLLSIENLFETCSKLYPEEMANHVIIVSSPTSGSPFPRGKSGEAWRGNLSHRQEAFTKILYERIGHLVDGIIPIFEMTAARAWVLPPADGVHHFGQSYYEFFLIHMSAILSAFKYRGIQLPRMTPGLNETRWFTGLPLD